jgi:hypothetical protein
LSTDLYNFTFPKEQWGAKAFMRHPAGKGMIHPEARNVVGLDSRAFLVNHTRKTCLFDACLSLRNGTALALVESWQD